MLDTLKIRLAEPEDFDGAMYHLGQVLGIFDEDTEFRTVKHIFWSRNELCEFLARTLRSLAEQGYLVYHDELDAFQWKGVENKSP
jgi:hypothetical protein